jgi:hypothetical protein
MEKYYRLQAAGTGLSSVSEITLVEQGIDVCRQTLDRGSVEFRDQESWPSFVRLIRTPAGVTMI